MFQMGLVDAKGLSEKLNFSNQVAVCILGDSCFGVHLYYTTAGDDSNTIIQQVTVLDIKMYTHDDRSMQKARYTLCARQT